MYRLFVAIPLPGKIRRQLAGLAHGLPGARWVPEEQFHLTLRFIGEVDGAMFRDITAALATVRAPAFSLKVKGVGCFGGRKGARVLWAGVEADDTLYLLQRRIESVLAHTGVEPERRRFSPHITLARFRTPPPRERLGRFVAGNNLFASDVTTIQAFRLYSSFLSPKGATHRVEAEYPLA